MHVGVIARLLEDTGLDVSQVEGVLNANVYLPIKTQKDRLAGFKKRQMYTANVSRYGHAFSCDALINLSDRCSGGDVGPGARFVLQADGTGLCTALALELNEPARRVA